MKISGFTLVRHGVEFDYPFVESLNSLLPWVDELIINLGRGTDETPAALEAWRQTLSEGDRAKIQSFESDWQLDQPEKKRGGLILSEQTNLALARCTGDWCVYLQADEVLHEADREAFRTQLQAADRDPQVDGLVFDYVHFYGSFDVVQISRSAYRREVRAIRRLSGARSVGDAQSFRKSDGSKLTVIPAKASVYHYGWVRTPQAMRDKTFFMDQLYHGDPSAEQSATQTPHTGENYRYKRFWGLRSFAGSHPKTMKRRIAERGWKWDLDHSPFEWTWKDAKKIILDLFERATGKRLFEYRSYRLKK